VHFSLRSRYRVHAAVLASMVALACSRPAIYTIGLNAQLRTIDVGGIPAASLSRLAKADWTDAQWQALMQVSVKAAPGGRPPAIVGRYTVADAVLRFTPMFPFDDGREYDVRFDPSALPGSGATPGGTSLAATVTLPAVARTPSTVVSHLYPSGNVVPANQLRMYLHFSAPMDWRSGYDYITLLDDRGQEVVDTFLPLDADFWNHDRTRYTVFFDPGRVKRGILPNRRMGRPLRAGGTFSILVARDWPDAHGQPLSDGFKKTYRVLPAREEALSTRTWRITAPAPGTRDPLRVAFPFALDRGLLQRALTIVHVDASGERTMAGDVTVEPGETAWRFVPADTWSTGDYMIAILPALEDPSGNRIGQAFETRDSDDRDPGPPARLPFSIR